MAERNAKAPRTEEKKTIQSQQIYFETIDYLFFVCNSLILIEIGEFSSIHDNEQTYTHTQIHLVRVTIKTFRSLFMWPYNMCTIQSKWWVNVFREVFFSVSSSLL